MDFSLSESIFFVGGSESYALRFLHRELRDLTSQLWTGGLPCDWRDNIITNGNQLILIRHLII